MLKNECQSWNLSFNKSKDKCESFGLVRVRRISIQNYMIYLYNALRYGQFKKKNEKKSQMKIYNTQNIIPTTN